MEAIGVLWLSLIVLLLFWIYADVSKIRQLLEDRKDKDKS